MVIENAIRNIRFFVAIMKLLREVYTASQICFYLVGSVIFVAMLFWRNQTFAYQAEMVLRYIDLPFAFVCLLYAGTGIRLALIHHIEEKNKIATQSGDDITDTENPIIDAVFMIAGLTIFFALVYVDFALPDIM
jgi:hypothetical protein